MDGTHPVLRHVPPGRLLSTRATFIPTESAWKAMLVPTPAPITITSYSFMPSPTTGGDPGALVDAVSVLHEKEDMAGVKVSSDQKRTFNSIRGAIGSDIYEDLDILAYESTAGPEGLASPQEPEVFTVDHERSRKADAFFSTHEFREIDRA